LRPLSKLGVLYRRRRKSATQSQLFSLNAGNVVVVDVVVVDVVVAGGGKVGGARMIFATLTFVGLTCMLIWKVYSSVSILNFVILWFFGLLGLHFAYVLMTSVWLWVKTNEHLKIFFLIFTD